VVGLIWYGVYDSPAICRYKEPIISRILGRNQWPTVPEVFYLDQQTGLEILHARVYHNEGKRRYGFLLGLVLCRLVDPPLQLGVVGPYLVWGVWLPNPLLLE
jgi:hypothetical protein